MATGGIAVPKPDSSQWERLLGRLGIRIDWFALPGDWLARCGIDLTKARVLAVATAGVAMVLLLIESMLYVPTDWSIEDFLGWADDGPAGPVAAMLQLWNRCQFVWLARSYLLLDSIVFVPLYAAFFLAVGLMLSRALAADAGAAAGALGSRRAEFGWWSIFCLPVLALGAVDLFENSLGLARTEGVAGWACGNAALIIGALLVLRLAALRQWRNRFDAAGSVLGMVAWAGLVTVVLALAGWTGDACAAAIDASFSGRLGCGAHRAKGWLIGVVIGVPVAAALCWLFGVVLKPKSMQPGEESEAALRVRLRAAVFDCIVRSRYVLIALALLTGLTVGLDQARDVVASGASFVPRIAAMRTWHHALPLIAGSLLVFAVSALALGALVFCCWLWTRSACHLMSAQRSPISSLGPAPGARYEDHFARDWARGLSLVPVALLVLLCSRVLEDIAKTGLGGTHPDAGWWSCLLPSVGVIVFALLGVVVGGYFVWRRGEHPASNGYYDCIDWREWSRRAGFARAPGLRRRVRDEPHASKPEVEKYSFLAMLSPYLLPIVALGAALLCRMVDLLPGRSGEYVPSMAFAIILLSLTFWLCVFGWLSLLEIRTAVPWVLMLIALVGGLGWAGLTDNHLVWSAALQGDPDPWGGLKMLLFTSALALVLLLAYRWAIRVVRALAATAAAGSDPPAGHDVSAWRAYGRLLVLLPALVAVVIAGNYWASSRRPQPPSEQAASDVGSRPALDAALAGWLRTICNSGANDSPCRPAIAPGADGGLEVYFVSTEGGGIRAAVWTAMTLQQLAERDASFAARTFSISGVSGGAVGAAVYRACSGGADAGNSAQCVRRFAETDLLSPLLSSWLFEDMLGRILPSYFCGTPACGFLSRGAWFEQAMEVPAPRLRNGLAELRRLDAPGLGQAPRVPYLLLNATWVETGERAIASDLRVETTNFPGAKDQLSLTGADMPLGAAAHNAARFPYINAIGTLKAPPERCDHRGAGDPEPVRPGASAEPKACGHLADGGYFDNGGAQSTTDIVRALQRCLTVHQPSPGADLAPLAGCRAIPAAQREWLRVHLVPRVLMIRNESNPRADDDTGCGAQSQPTFDQVMPAPRASCLSRFGKRYRPDRPLCARRKVPYLDLFGPLLAVVNTSGIGSNGRLAEVRQHVALTQARIAMGGAAAASETATVTTLDLLPRGVHFPLGWHLSRAAVDDMAAQASACKCEIPASPPLVAGTPPPC